MTERKTCPPDHLHGRTVTCYKTHKCRCKPCTARSTKAARDHYAKTKAGYKHFVPIGPMVNHVLHLFAEGMSQNDIARRSGISEVTLSRVMRGKQTRVYGSTARAVMAVQPRESVKSGGVVDGLTTRRRLGALTALGYTTYQLSAELGKKQGFVSCVLHAQNVTPATKAAVVELYEKLCMTVPPETVSAKRARTFAAKNGFPPPLAWDDIDTDPEPAREEKQPNPSPKAWVLEELDHLKAAGESASAAIRALGRNRASTASLAFRHGRADLGRWLEEAA